MNILEIALVFVVLVGILSVKWRTELSAFELSRRAEKEKSFAKMEKFRETYPGFLIFSRLLALLVAALLVGLIFANFGFAAGWILSFALLILAWLISRFLEDFSVKMLSRKLDFLLKYFSWTSVFSRISRLDGEVKIASKHELLHVISGAEFLDENEKKLLAGAAEFREKTVKNVMIPRKEIKFVHAKDELTPLFIDELFETGHKLFPVVNKDLDSVVGLLDLDDFREISGEQKILGEKMRPIFEPVIEDMTLAALLETFAKDHETLALVAKNGKITGLVSLLDVERALSER